MEKHQLSKSTFIRGVQCLKSLYLNKKRYFLRDKLSDEQRLKFKRGSNVGKIAQQLFPGGKNLQPGHFSQYRKAVENTSNAIDSGIKIIYEAGFQYNGVLVFLDVLIRNDDGSFHAVEVKSSKAISETFILDAALQYYVISGSGLNISQFSVAYINTNYILENQLDLKLLFKLEDVLEKIKPKQKFIEEHIEKEKQVFSLKHSPEIDIGRHCDYPYPCDFKGHCWKNIPKPSVFTLSSLSIDQKFEFYQDKCLEINDLLSCDKNISDDVRKELIAYQSDKILVDHEKLQYYLDNSKDAIILKVSSFIPAIPYIKGMHPYEEVVYLLSYSTKDGNIEHLLVEENHLYSEMIQDKFIGENFVVYDQKEALANILEKNTIKPKKIIDVADLFNDQIIINPDLSGNFETDNVFGKLIGKDWNAGDSVKNDLLAAEIYSTYLESDNYDLLNSIKNYNQNFISAVNKLMEYIQRFK